ncbi:HlyD family efflux transporter periplasmic adaptor subunit [Chryseobacterium sp. 1B4]
MLQISVLKKTRSIILPKWYSFEQLRKSLEQWEQNYLVTSSTDGIVSFQQFFGENQFVKSGDVMVTVLPKNKDVLVGRMQIPSVNSGKVASGKKC